MFYRSSTGTLQEAMHGREKYLISQSSISISAAATYCAYIGIEVIINSVIQCSHIV